MYEIEEIFANINEKYEGKMASSRRSIKRILATYLPDVEFIPSENKHFPDNVAFKKEKISAIQSAKSMQDLDSEMKVIFQCAKLIRNEIAHSESFEFDGELKGRDVLNENKKLCQLLKWIIVGFDKSQRLCPKSKTTEVENKVSLIAETILYESKTNRQMKHVNENLEISKFRHSKEYPTQLGIAIYLHQQYRSKDAINFFIHWGYVWIIVD